jgi:preprotein translocase subunit SecA
VRAGALPTRELAFVGYPQRSLDTAAPWWSERLAALRASLPGPRAAALPPDVKQGLDQARARLERTPAGTLKHSLPSLRARIRAGNLRGATAGWALALAEWSCRRHLELAPYDTQLLAAWLMLDGRFAEVATGEGKTVAMALAASAAALAGVPVHVMTANDYLVQRDRDRMAPLYDGLDLTSACVLPSMSRPQRAQAYRCDIVVVTAREVAFDYLRDHLLLSGVRDPRLLQALEITASDAAMPAASVVTTQGQRATTAGHPHEPRDTRAESTTAFGDWPSVFADEHDPVGLAVMSHDDDTRDDARDDTASDKPATPAVSPVLPGLCLGLVDEADSILLDEASVPLILAAPFDAVEVQAYHRALSIAATLRRGRDYRLGDARRCELDDEGREAVSRAVENLGEDAGLMRPMRRAHELVEAALSALHGLRRDRDYVVRDGRLQLIDEVTGRIAEGRQWTGPLQAMVELVEGLAPSPSTHVSAQITYQRFFPRYLRLSGMSGTLAEARRELRVCYGSSVRRVPLCKPDRRHWLGEQVFVDSARRDAALVARVKKLSEQGRPVLVGTDSVGASQRVARALRDSGLEPQVLNAMQDAHEAQLVAHAGCAGVVTVATNMAGRGTDIALDTAARAAGGLHVVATMRNRSRRIDRQLIGRAARHGDPGSAESMLALDDAFFADTLAPWLRDALVRCADAHGVVRAAVARPLTASVQRRAEARDNALRARLRQGEQRADELFAFAGGVE